MRRRAHCAIVSGWFLASAAMLAAAPPAENRPPRGAIIATAIQGDVRCVAGESRTMLHAGDNVAVGAQITTGATASAKFTLSNGAALRLGADSELAIQEFYQDPSGASSGPGLVKREPSVSQVTLLLLRGDLAGRAPALNLEGGSHFVIATIGGELVVRRAPDPAGSGGGKPLSEATLAALQAGGFRAGAADGCTVFRVVYQPASATQGELTLGNGSGNLDFVYARSGGAKTAVPDQREIEISITRAASPAIPAVMARRNSSSGTVPMSVRVFPGIGGELPLSVRP